MQIQESKRYKEVLEEVRRCMAQILDDCELELGSSPRWRFFRSRLLRTFGDRGLEGKIREILENEFSK